MANAFFLHNHEQDLEFSTRNVSEDSFIVDSISYYSSDSSIQIPGPSNRSTLTDNIGVHRNNLLRYVIQQSHVVDVDVNDSAVVNSSLGLGLGLQDDHVSVFDEVDSRLSRPHNSDDGFSRRVVNNAFHDWQRQVSTMRIVDPVDQELIESWMMLLNEVELELYNLIYGIDHIDHDIENLRIRDNDQYDGSFMFGDDDIVAGIEIPNTGGAPASKSVVEKLPWVVITEEDVVNEKAVCAVCTFQIEKGENAKQLPCSHFYHADCIFPWLRIRNTCPICRYQLPTDN